MLPQHAIKESTQRLPKGQRHEKRVLFSIIESIIGNKVRNGMASTSTGTLAKGNGKVNDNDLII